jgi:hypothetical protein
LLMPNTAPWAERPFPDLRVFTKDISHGISVISQQVLALNELKTFP